METGYRLAVVQDLLPVKNVIVGPFCMQVLIFVTPLLTLLENKRLKLQVLVAASVSNDVAVNQTEITPIPLSYKRIVTF